MVTGHSGVGGWVWGVTLQHFKGLINDVMAPAGGQRGTVTRPQQMDVESQADGGLRLHL